MKILIFFQVQLDLGHATRDIAIAKNFQNISTNFVTGSGAAKFFAKCNFDVDDVYNPPILLLKMVHYKVH